jgi:GH15 family glucan-1,4-alpha-glucosidase
MTNTIPLSDSNRSSKKSVGQVMASPIEDYAMIGDCHTAALVARNGSIDWLCFPRFDSRACFAALLGNEEHGRWMIAPVGEILRIDRHYRNDTLVLETDYETADGAMTLIDCMPPRSQEPRLVRVVVGRRGQVRMRMELSPPGSSRMKGFGKCGARGGTSLILK